MAGKWRALKTDRGCQSERILVTFKGGYRGPYYCDGRFLETDEWSKFVLKEDAPMGSFPIHKSEPTHIKTGNAKCFSIPLELFDKMEIKDGNVVVTIKN
jgi:hypothetical protein